MRRVGALSAVATALLAIAPATAGAAPPSGKRAKVLSLQAISGPTPFSDDCGDPGPGDGIAGGEAEPHLSVNPRESDHLLATWQQDRYSDFGAARSDLTAVSFDGGETWRRSLIPNLSWCTAADEAARERTLPRATDPVTAIGSDGVAYHASSTLRATEAEVDSDLPVAVSRGGGGEWREPLLVAADDGTFGHEKPVMTADPRQPGRVYAAWAQHLMPDSSPLDPTAVTFNTAIGFSRTDDGGKSWLEEPVVIPPDLPGIAEWPTDIATLPRQGGGSTVVVIYYTAARRTGVQPYSFFAVHSDDGGDTWSDPAFIGAITGVIPSGDAEQLIEVSDGLGVARLAAGPDGELYATWHERTPAGVPAGGTVITVARSDDRGGTWTTSTVANLPHQAFLPTVAVARDGTVGVTFYDFRHDELGDAELTTDVWLRYSRDRGESWRELHLAGPFDVRTAPNTGDRYMLGDYMGLVGLPNGFGALFTASKPLAVDGPSDVFFSRIRIARSNRFRIVRQVRNERRGTARLVVRVPGSGRLVLRRSPRTKRDVKRPQAAGRVRLAVEPRGAAKRTLSKRRCRTTGNRRLHARVRATVVFRARGGGLNRKHRRVRLVRSC